ncbi:hypothetical protein OQA88_11135 [Cercophora sp. LCS_1]
MAADHKPSTKSWMKRNAARWCVVFAYPGLWRSEEVQRARRYSGWARFPIYLVILLFNWSDFGIFFDRRQTPNTPLQNLLVFVMLMNGLFPVVDVGTSSVLRNTHVKLCQPWQRHHLGIHGLLTLPLLFITTGILVLVLTFRVPELWPEPTNGFQTPVGTVAPAMVLFMSVCQLSALGILLFHPSLGLPDDYEPVGRKDSIVTASSLETPTGLLASRFLKQQESTASNGTIATFHNSTAIPPRQEEQASHQTVTVGGPDTAYTQAPHQMDFYPSLKSWIALSSIERNHTTRTLVMVATLVDIVAGWMYFGITIQLPHGTQSCPR